MTQLSPEARRLLQLAQGQDEPSPKCLRRAEHSLAVRIARGIGATAAGAMWAQTASGFALGTSKLVAVAALAGATTAVGYWALPVRAPGSAASSAPARARAEIGPQARAASFTSDTRADLAVQKSEVPEESLPAATSSPTPHTVAPAVHVQREPTEITDRLREETEELRQAQQALRAGNAGLALELLSQQDRTFRDGVLQQERSAARVMALCENGQGDLARIEAKGFEQRWPKSPLVARIRSSCR